MRKEKAHISEYSFDNINDFKNSLLYGREIQFTFNNIEYGIFRDCDDGEKQFFVCEAHKDEEGTYFKSVEEVLDFKIQGKLLRDIITQLNVFWRNI